MKIAEAAGQGIERVCLPWWHKGAYLKLHVAEDGTYGPWVELYDRPAQEALGQSTPERINVGLADAPYLVPYEGDLDEADVSHART